MDIYGKVLNIVGASSFIPFRYQGQYEDVETKLYYNRFRYYSPHSGCYISQDPIGLLSGEDNFYAYVSDVNTWVDVFGLDVYALYTTSDGWYPVYTKGSVRPTYTFLKKNTLYKIGETQNSSRGYSKPKLREERIKSKSATDGINFKAFATEDDDMDDFLYDEEGNVLYAGLRMQFIGKQGGTKEEDRLKETETLEDYKKNNNGMLPAGNKNCN